MLRTRSRPVSVAAGRFGISAGVIPQPSGSSGRYQPAPACLLYASPRTYGGVTPAGCVHPVYGTCTNVLMPTASAREIVAAHCSYDMIGKKSDPFSVMRVPSVPKCADADAAAVVSEPLVDPAWYVYVVDAARSVSVTECDVDGVLSRCV